MTTTETLQYRADRTVEKYNMIKKGSAVLIGLSGGADSVALTFYLLEKSREVGFRISAIHLNHMLRGAESVRDAEFVQKLCDKQGIKLYYKEADVAGFSKENGIGLEHGGRILRYRYFEETAKELDAKIATAHTLNDRVETLFLNTARGSSMSGLIALKPVRENIIRPIIECTREQVEEYCGSHGLDYITDSSNSDPVFTRNRIRQSVISVMKDINPNFLAGAQNLISSLERDEELLDSLTRESYSRVAEDNGLNAVLLKEENPSLQYRVVNKWLKEQDISSDNGLISRILLMENGSKLNAAGDVFIYRQGDSINTRGNTGFRGIKAFNHKLSEGENRLDCGDFTVFIIPYFELNKLEKIYKKFLIYAFDYDIIKGNVCVRQRRAGDNITIAGRGVTKTLKKLFNEKKLEGRDSIPVIADDETVLAVAGFETNAHAAVSQATKTVLAVIYEPKGDAVGEI